jgi:Domain of unknown function (DUF1707)
MTEARMRAGHSDRQSAVDRLTEHFTEGRLDPNEFDQRIGTAYAVTYLDELPGLFADLPAAAARAGDRSGRPWPSSDRPQLTGSGRPHGMRPAGRGRPPVAFAVVGVLLVLAIFFGVSALLFGLFPFPLLWIGLLVFLIARGGARRRRWAQQGGYSNSGGWERNGRYGDSPGWSGHGGCGSRRR